MIDTHAHLDDEMFKEDLDDVLARSQDSGVTHIITAGSDLESSRAAVALAERHPIVYAAVGVHPHESAKMHAEDIQAIRELCARPKVVAIGEIGLDFYRSHSPAEAQVEVFQKHLDLAAETGLPIVVHSRGAAEETYAILADWAGQLGSRTKGVMHCFGGDSALAMKYVDLGFYISIAGPVTYPNGGRTREVAQAVPLDKLVMETDSPALAPQSRRGKRNDPSCLIEVASCIAAVKSVSLGMVSQITAENAMDLFDLKTAKVPA